MYDLKKSFKIMYYVPSGEIIMYHLRMCLKDQNETKIVFSLKNCNY